MNLTLLEKAALRELRSNVESEYEEGWGSVYLDNCEHSGNRQWAGVLSSLTKKGLYREQDFCFGEVKLNSQEI